MKIWTSYYANIRNIPKDYLLVSASGGITEDIENAVDVWDKKLAPSKSIFNEYKGTGDWKGYTDRFKEERLPKVDWLERLEQWEESANKIGKEMDNIVILCYEKPSDFCHRQILAENVEETFKTKVDEFGHEDKMRNNYRMEIENNMDLLF